MKQLPTVTIGIPAYNEEANIQKLLKALLQQKTTNYRLEKIIVVSDGSTDRTEELVKSIKRKQILLLINKRRLGLNATQNKILRKSKSDILVLFDADVLPKDKNCVASLISLSSYRKILSNEAYKWSKKFSWEESAQKFLRLISHQLKTKRDYKQIIDVSVVGNKL